MVQIKDETLRRLEVLLSDMMKYHGDIPDDYRRDAMEILDDLVQAKKGHPDGAGSA